MVSHQLSFFYRAYALAVSGVFAALVVAASVRRCLLLHLLALLCERLDIGVELRCILRLFDRRR